MAWIAIVLGALLALAFAPFLFGPYTLLNSSRDTPSLYGSGATQIPGNAMPTQKTLDASSGLQNEPWFELEHNEIFAFHDAPFWNPYQAYGTPLAAAMQPQPFHPLSWIVEAKPSSRSYDVFLILRLYIAGLFTALFIRLFCCTAAALMAGIAASFGGYFLLFYSMPHLSVETLLPALLWSIELLLRAPSLKRSGYVAVIIGLIILGGMPESAALVLTCGASYFLVRVVSIAEKRKATACAVTGVLLGITAGSVVLLPFAEYVANSYNTHQPRFLGATLVGLQGDAPHDFARFMLTELAPLAFGPPLNSITMLGGLSGVRGFSGMVVFFLAFTAIVGTFRVDSKRFTQPIFFFAVVVLILELKRFGSPLVNWMGALPIYRLIVFPKYDEAIVTICMALLCGFGSAAIFERRVGRSTILGAAFGAMAILSLLYFKSRQLVPIDMPGALCYYGAISLAIICSASAAFGAVLGLSRLYRRRTAGLAMLAFALILESTSNYYVPLFIFLNRPTPASINAYAGAPYITFLKKVIGSSATRVLGYPVDLFPNWSSAYALDDTRTIDGILTGNYAQWMTAFNPGNTVHPNDHYSTINVENFNDPAFIRWLTLSSIGYVIVPNDTALATHDSPFLSKLWLANGSLRSKIAEGHVRRGPYVVDSRTENALYEEPNITLDAPTTVSEKQPFFTVDLALDPRAYEGPPCGSPLRFRLSVLDAVKRSVLAASTYTIDPLRVRRERAWQTKILDLRGFVRKSVVMRLQTLDVNDNLCKAWPLWGEPRFVSHAAEPLQTAGERYNLVYAGDVNIYRFSGVLPRISIFHDVKQSTDQGAALTMLHDGAVDVSRTALVDENVAVEPATGSETVRILERTSSRFEANVTLTSPGLIMLNDTFYPGWTARVDATPTPIIRTDFLFRGIAVPKGTHHVVFAYRSTTVTAGIVLTYIGLFGIIAALLYRPRLGGGTTSFLTAVPKFGSRRVPARLDRS